MRAFFVFNCLAAFVTLCTCTPLSDIKEAEGKQRPCDGGVPHNGTTERGGFWYLCKDRLLVPKGCLDRQGHRVNVGDNFTSGNIEITCALSPDGSYPLFANTACVFNGNRILPNVNYESDRAWVSCDRVEQALVLTIHGCMLDGRRYKLQERVRYQGQQNLECQRHKTAGAMFQALGCIFQGADYRIGEQFQDNRFKYSCELTDDEFPERSVRRPVACIHNGRLYYDMQRYKDGNQLYKCVIGPYLNASHEITGCIVQLHRENEPTVEVDKFIGCYWIENEARFKNAGYLMHCSLVDGSAKVSRDHCLYNTTQGYQLEMTGGCYRPIPRSDQVVACMQNTAMLIETTVIKRTDLQMPQYSKLTLC